MSDEVKTKRQPRAFARLEGRRLVRATHEMLREHDDAWFADNGWKRYRRDGDPKDWSDRYVTRWKLEETEDELVLRLVAKLRNPRVFSRLNLELALFKAGLLERLDEFLLSTTITNEMGQRITLKRAYDLANELNEGHELFVPYLKLAQRALGVDDETVERILDAAVMR